MMRQFQVNSYLFGGNAPYVEDLYERYLDNPRSVPEQWRAYFDQMQLVPGADGSPDSRDVAHATKDRPVVENGQIVVRPMNYLALSYDHRIIDGREAVLGLVAMKEALEDPARLLFDI